MTAVDPSGLLIGDDWTNPVTNGVAHGWIWGYKRFGWSDRDIAGLSDTVVVTTATTVSVVVGAGGYFAARCVVVAIVKSLKKPKPPKTWRGAPNKPYGPNGKNVWPTDYNGGGPIYFD